MPDAVEEVFGPVAVIMTAETDDEAVVMANASRFGLGAAVFTADGSRADAIVAKLDAGNVFVNDYVRSDARMPFGGVKDSGYGRELGPFGLREFVNVKSVVTI
jgi:succinate-semialdehyde dehydrogenase/glutarate-semialdehyde dehydrogenase